MQASERERLMKAYCDAPAVRAGTAIKCGACLALVALVAAIGAGAGEGGAAGHRVYAAAARPPVPVSAEPHRKAVFDERRARFGGESHRVATQNGPSPYPAP